jgi:hypothetical protein
MGYSPLLIFSFFPWLWKGASMQITVKTKKKYGPMRFLGDVIMTVITGGLWLIWIFVREMRNR